MFETGTVIIDNNLDDGAKSYLFKKPVKLIIAYNKNEAIAAFGEIDAYIEKGYFLAGYFSYELGYCFEEQFANLLPANVSVPLIWLGVYETRQELLNCEVEKLLEGQIIGGGFRISRPNYSQSQEEYCAKFSKIHKAIESGTIYQANLTFKATYEFSGNPIALYNSMRKEQKTKCGAFINTGETIILSRSPEIFFEKQKSQIKVIPMKGTIARAKTIALDKGKIELLRNDEKQRAENLMIVDLMRNDLSRISEPGSVKVEKLFEIETYDTLHQMVSIIKAELKPRINTAEIMKAIFPCGSITGAPKISAMEQIANNENEPRGVYCGAIGHFAPDGSAKFNVAIRTAIIKGEAMTLGIGSGIVYDSRPKSEYSECKLKASFIEKAMPKFAIFETLLWQRDFGFHRLERHLERLRRSAQELEFDLDEGELDSLIENFCPKEGHAYARVKIELGDKLCISYQDFIPSNAPMKFLISQTKMQSNNPLLNHKTTQRQIYDSEWRELCDSNGVDEIVYFNEFDELTEGSRTNIFVDFGDNKLVTPPIKCGALPGILRQELLETGKAKEQIIVREDFKNVKQFYLGNSLRGLRKAIFKSD